MSPDLSPPPKTGIINPTSRSIYRGLPYTRTYDKADQSGMWEARVQLTANKSEAHRFAYSQLIEKP